MSGIRFIHTGDLHLGSPLRAVGKISEELRQSILASTQKALIRMVDCALEEDVDFVVMAGDIYDNEARSVKDNRLFAQEMKRLEGENIPVFIIYGNHDPIGKGADYFRLPANVKILGAKELEMHLVRDGSGRARARLIGQSYATPSETRRIHLNYQPPADDLLNIALLHTGLNPGANTYVPCSPEELKELTAIDYWALGHIHSPTIINDSHPVIAYCGIPQGRDVGESGVKGCLLVDLTASGAAEVRFVPTSPIIWLTPSLLLKPDQPLHNMDDLIDMLLLAGQEIIASRPEMPLHCPAGPWDYEPEGYVVRWEIGGRNDIHASLIRGNEGEIAAELAEILNQHLTGLRPYLWTEGVKLHTASPIPNLDLLLKQDKTIQTLQEVKLACQKDPELKKKAISAMGNIFYRPRDPEDLRDDTFPVTEERLNTLLEDAFNMVLERIIQEREKQ